MNLDSPDSPDVITQEVRIEIIPLIDVIFCILTFFILAAVSLTRQQALDLDLPQASTGTPQMREMLLVSIDFTGQTYVEDQPVTLNQLSQVLTQYQQQVPEGIMVLYASRDARYAEVVEVLDLLRSVGGDRVALATLPEGAGQAELDNLDGLSPLPLPSDPLSPPGSTTPLNPSDPLNSPDSGNPPGSEPLPLFPGGNLDGAPSGSQEGLSPDGLTAPSPSGPDLGGQRE